MAMDYTTMMQGVPQMGMPFDTTNALHQPRHAFSFPYNGDPLFLVPHLPPHHGNITDSQALAQASKQTEPKPRLAKDEVQLLENEFQKNPKPSSQRKREIAELLKVDNPRINNWFQNRRAKAKQMLRREGDPRAPGDVSPSASSSSERQDDSLVSEYYGSRNQSLPLRASSATFPALEQPSLALYPPTTNTSIAHGTSPSAEEYPSPKSLVLPPGASHDLAYAPVMNGFLTSHNPAGFGSQASPHHSGSIGSDQGPNAQDFEQSLDVYVPFTTAMGMEPVMAHVGSYHSELLGVDDVPQLDKDLIVMPSCEVQSLDQGLSQQMSSPGSAHSSASAVSDLRFKSPPPPANIATRRNKGVPAMLNSTALRNQAFGPKTGVDLGKRIEGPTPIRRIASATGLLSNRIQKPGMPPAPRSPLYFERNKEALLQSLQTATAAASGTVPLVRSLSNNVSPVTPSEALASVQRGVADAMIGSSSSDDEHILPFGAAAHHPFFGTEPTLKTPPGTPGFNGMPPADHRVIEAPWSFVPQDEALLTPSLGSFGSDEFPMLQPAPTYIMSSQPPTPSVNQPLGHSYFPLRLQGGATGQADYTFPGEAYMLPGASAKSSPGRSKNKQFQFTPNVTPQDFSNDK